MHPDLFYEALFFCARDDLERLQPVSRALLKMIVHSSKVLALRPIRYVWMDSVLKSSSKDKMEVGVGWREARGEDDKPDYEASLHDGDFAETFRRLQHACITNFHVDIRDSAFFSYWKAQESAFTVENILFGVSDTTDYGILDSIVNHLRPRTTGVVLEASSWHENGYNSKKLALLTRDTFLNHLQTCWLAVRHKDAFPPSAFILKEPGYRNYELLCYYSSVAGEIDRFIESFVRDGCANKKLESVAIKWFDGEDQQSPAPKKLSKPTKADVPLPKLHMMTWVARNSPRVSQCEMHSFVNAKQRLRLEVVKWTVEYEPLGRRCTTHLLQCRLKSL